MSNQIPDAIQLAFLMHKYPIKDPTYAQAKLIKQVQISVNQLTGPESGLIFIKNTEKSYVHIHVSVNNKPKLANPRKYYRIIDDALGVRHPNMLTMAELPPEDAHNWGFVTAFGVPNEICTLDFHGDIDMPKPAASKPKKPSLSQLQKDALEVHRTKLEIELNAALSNVEQKIMSVDAARATLRKATYVTLNTQALVEVKKLYQPILDGLKTVGFNVELQVNNSTPQSDRAYTAVPEKITYKVTITEVKQEQTRNEPRYSSSAYYDPESGSTKRDGSRLRRVDPFMYPIEQDQRAFAIMQMMSKGPGYFKFNPFFGGGNLDVEVALISKDYIFSTPEDLKAKLVEAETLNAEGETLRKEKRELERKLDGLSNLERVFLAALAEDNLMQSKEGKELLGKIGSIPELPLIK